MKVVLYTIGCPSCVVLEKKLTAKGIDFEKIDDIEIIKEKGFEGRAFPILEVNDSEMDYKTAIEWINKI